MRKNKIKINLYEYEERLVPCQECNHIFLIEDYSEPVLCNLCKNRYIPYELYEKHHNISLDKKNYKALLISDMGYIPVGKKIYRFATWFCNNCQSVFIKRTSTMKRTNQISCDKCILNSSDKIDTKNRVFLVWNVIKKDIIDEWSDFNSFKKWSLENNYEDYHILHRKDKEKPYSPSNCEWIRKNTPIQRKKRKNNTLQYKGIKCINQNKYIAQISINNRKIHIGTYSSAKEAALAYDEYIIQNNLKRNRNFA